MLAAAVAERDGASASLREQGGCCGATEQYQFATGVRPRRNAQRSGHAGLRCDSARPLLALTNPG